MITKTIKWILLLKCVKKVYLQEEVLIVWINKINISWIINYKRVLKKHD